MHIVVAGAGPAGIITAMRLTQLGHRVTLLAPQRRPPAMEGLSRRAVYGLRMIGFEAALSECLTEVERTVKWNGAELKPGTEFLVERSDLDAGLVATAREFAEVSPAALVAAAAEGGKIRLRLLQSDGAQTVGEADFLVDARVRSAPGGRPRLVGPRTVALCCRYDGALPPGSWVESGPQGWAWLAATGDGGGFLQASMAAPRGALAGPRALAAHADRLVATLPGIARLLAAATRRGPVIARLATPGLSLEPVAGEQIRVGDAALALDPLSGHGVFEAVAGASAAAAVVNTILCRPPDAAVAREFYRTRMRDNFRSRAHHGQAQYVAEERWADEPFWAERRAWAAQSIPSPEQPPRAVVETRAVIEDGWIRKERVIVTADQPRGVWRVDGVPVVTLSEHLSSGRAPEDAARALGCPIAAVRSAETWLARHPIT